MFSLPNYKIKIKLFESDNVKIYTGFDLEKERPVVLKSLRLDRAVLRDREQLLNEFELLSSFQLEGVIKAYSLERTKNHWVLILEDNNSISLHQFLKDKTHLNIDDFFKIALPLTGIISNLHDAKIIHKDINPSNFILNPETGKVTLIDFGLASQLDRENPVLINPDILEGTLAYLSPEQTGRMNRFIDYRTDLYSLGVTFYEILTGQLPFTTTNALELVHAHIAKQPIAPHLIASQIPPTLSAIILKLMAKNAEDRYQSARGLQWDLIECQKQWKKEQKIEPFLLGQQDQADRFQIPQKLYGREEEIATLLTAFADVGEELNFGRPRLILVTGYSGIGKSALVHELYKPITAKKGYFIGGKFDQLQRNVPYAAFIQAFKLLVQQLLTESENAVAIWREKILVALAENAQLAIEVIPELELIIGPQPPVTELPPTEAQNRFNQLLQNFIGVFSQPQHPLIIFLDDLQWADSGSLKLMEYLLSEKITSSLFLIGAYRDNEVSASHPLFLTLDQLVNEGAMIETISLKPLTLTHLSQLIAETLHTPEANVKYLADLILKKTGGIPFFVNEFLKTLYSDGLIYFGTTTRAWQWDLEQIRAREITDNVVELMAQKIDKLPPETQSLLMIGACIGDRFDLFTLAIAADQTRSQIVKDIRPAILEGFIFVINTPHKYAEEAKILERNSDYKFAHDRIQQAAYSLIPETEKQAIHLKIGQLLLENTSENFLEENLFTITNQLNLGLDLIKELSQQNQLASLNLAAGRKARSASAFVAAYEYFKTGINLLPEDSWEQHYDLSLNLYEAAVETAWLSGEFTEMERLSLPVLEKAKDLLDRVQVYQIKIKALEAENKMLEGVMTALQVLELLGVSFPTQLGPEVLFGELQQTRQLLANQTIESLLELPAMSDPLQLAAVGILTSIIPATHQSKPELYPLMIFRKIRLYLQYGNGPASPFSYACYGQIICGFTPDIDEGFRFGQLALQLAEKTSLIPLKSVTLFVTNYFINFWKLHLKETLKPLLEAYQVALEVGDMAHAGYSPAVYCLHSYYVGKELENLEREMQKYEEAIAAIKQEAPLKMVEIHRLAVLKLIEKSPINYNLEIAIEDNNKILKFYLNLNQMIIFYLFNDLEAAQTQADFAQANLEVTHGTFVGSLFPFYDSLIKLAIYPQSPRESQDSILQIIQTHQEKLQKWAEFAPMNFAHKYYLVSAEKERVLGNYITAMEWFDRAIQAAKQQGYTQEEALSYERAGKFYLALGREEIAQLYLTQAWRGYRSWGAKGKARNLEAQYPHCLGDVTSEHQSQNHSGTLNPLGSSSTSVALLDLATFLKASQALMRDLNLDKLLANLMVILIENAGAQSGCLLLLKEGKIFLEAKATIDQEPQVNLGEPLETIENLPISLIKYVERARVDVVLNDAIAEGAFRNDPYINNFQVQSVLCTPILNQGKLLAILYLENNLTKSAFTPKRLEVLRLLSAQVAIALDHGLLYAKLEEKVKERTQEINEKNYSLSQALKQLKRTQSQLIQTEKMSSLGQMVAGVAHEINNPINFIHGNLSFFEEYSQELGNLINLYQKYYPEPAPEIEEALAESDLEFTLQDMNKLIASMKEGSVRISNLVLGLRKFSHLDESEFKSVDIADEFENTLMLLESRLKASKNRGDITVLKHYSPLPLVTCYAAEMNQVFLNLLSNAIDAINEASKYRQEYQPQITIDLQLISETVLIRIADNGSGMSKEVKQKIFDPFFTTKPVGSGTGLGLSICHSIVVEQHKGTIICNSAPDRGTEFILELPLTPPA